MALVKNWLKLYETKQQALREMNKALGTKYGTSHLSRWERDERGPKQATRHYMLVKVLPTVLVGATAREIAKAAEALK